MRHLRAHDRLVPLPGIRRRRKQLDFFHLAAEMLDDLGESFFSIFIGAFPYRRLDERKHRRQRRLFGGDS